MSEPTNYQANSHKAKDAASEEPKAEKNVQKVVSGKIKKKGIGKRIAENFQGDDMSSVGSYILFEVMIPAAKDLLYDTVVQGVQRSMYGETRATARPGSRGSVGGRQSYTSYNQMSNPARQGFGQQQQNNNRGMTPHARATHNFDDILLKSRAEGESVLSEMFDILGDFESVTVSDLYTMVDITPAYTDNDFGWTNLEGASVSRVHSGYVLNLPRPVKLD